MQAQDAPELVVFKLWPWIEENRKRLGVGIIIAFLAVLVYSFISWRHDQNEIAAGQAMTQALTAQTKTSTADQIATAMLRVASAHPGTAAGARAELQGAATLFEAGEFAEAQAEFQNFINAYPSSQFKATATLGLAACLAAQGKNDDALALYQKVSGYSDVAAALDAKFAIASLNEKAGKLNEALSGYEEVARSGANTQFASEAAIRAVEIKGKLASAKPAVTITPQK